MMSLLGVGSVGVRFRVEMALWSCEGLKLLKFCCFCEDDELGFLRLR